MSEKKTVSSFKNIVLTEEDWQAARDLPRKERKSKQYWFSQLEPYRELILESIRLDVKRGPLRDMMADRYNIEVSEYMLGKYISQLKDNKSKSSRPKNNQNKMSGSYEIKKPFYQVNSEDL